MTLSFIHLEAVANAITGIMLAQIVLMVFGVPMHEALVLNSVMFGVSYMRAFALRVLFERWTR